MLSSAMSDTEPIETMPDAHALPDVRIAVPQHVVYRHFPSETVVFNLQTGQYHGLNATAGSMLAALERAACVRDAAAVVAEEYAQPPAVVEQDMRELCDALLARGLIEFDGEPSR
jgi:Coenzyme PQQ synthesis protein D (PqqD)